MPGMYEIIDTHSCCMRKNPTHEELMFDNLHTVFGLFGIYVGAYVHDLHSLSLAAMFLIYVVGLHTGIKWYNNLPDEIDDTLDDLSQRQKEQGALFPRGMTEEQETEANHRLLQFQQSIHNLNRGRMTKTPSATSLVDAD